MRKERCSDCYFWDFFADDIPEHMGTCYRYPPTIPYEEEKEDDKPGSTSPMSGEWTGPNTRGTHWCGEFKPK
jgi:hypothetical protein